MGSMTGRSCIVTGAAQGIGRAIGESLLNEGASDCIAGQIVMIDGGMTLV
jgi:meso-butanediol dehydrogenase/(S,S)-butanediol dehydrogenase/diacetyl reductase